MTTEQYEHWKDFSTRMAKHYPNATANRRNRLADEVKEWFSSLEDNSYWQHMISWDESEPYPGGKRYGLYSNYEYACDLFSEMFDREYTSETQDCDDVIYHKFWNQLACCVRAGMDTAAEPSTGVLGFNVGHLKSFYDGLVPDWICAAYDGADLNAAQDNEGIWL